MKNVTIVTVDNMNKYKKDEKLILEKQVRITKEAYEILRDQKKEQGISMAKIICNLISEKYE